ncbi:hypothetical protein GCM10017576_23540 [Microbacterium barkeri]|uniref:Uncharacterized protein n=1 Tax=Microbacterium barkeri TaxID=33917 RepID=A0A9W6H584_9MICO|nr:hypothetical protein [Microbacterium barkeri]MDI6944210.1 hypothetical protein [Microbacterium barkeri]MDR6876782.1 hypothetical protein [Microbacterium barkeri]GLJ62224.1 hypothetical protein GCM10017576_23540 [Microbacterium barkeri]
MEHITEPLELIIIRNRLYSLSHAPRGEDRYSLIGSQRSSAMSRYSYRREWAGMISLP